MGSRWYALSHVGDGVPSAASQQRACQGNRRLLRSWTPARAPTLYQFVLSCRQTRTTPRDPLTPLQGLRAVCGAVEMGRPWQAVLLLALALLAPAHGGTPCETTTAVPGALGPPPRRGRQLPARPRTVRAGRLRACAVLGSMPRNCGEVSPLPPPILGSPAGCIVCRRSTPTSAAECMLCHKDRVAVFSGTTYKITAVGQAVATEREGGEGMHTAPPRLTVACPATWPPAYCSAGPLRCRRRARS